MVRKDLFGRQVSIVVALPRRAVQRDAPQAAAGHVHGAVPRRDGGLPPLSGETESAQDLLHRARRGRRADPRDPARGAGGGGRTARAHLGRRSADALAARLGRTAAARRSPRSTRLGSPTTTRRPTPTGRSPSTTSLNLEELRAAPDGFVVGIGNESAGERLTRVQVSTRPAARSTCRRSCRCSSRSGCASVGGDPRPPRGRGDGRSSTTSASSTPAARCSTSSRGRAWSRDALGAMWRGEAEVDSLNRLVDRRAG